MDLGTLRRANSAWINDNSTTIEAIRWFKKGVNHVLPGCYANSAFLWMSHPERRQQTLASFKREGYPPYVMRSQFAGTLLLSEQSQYFSAKVKDHLRQEIANYKSVRHLLMKDFYPLFYPQSLAEFDGVRDHATFIHDWRCDGHALASPTIRTSCCRLTPCTSSTVF